MSSAFQIRKLDDTEFRNPWARAYIRVTFPLCDFNNLVGLLLSYTIFWILVIMFRVCPSF